MSENENENVTPSEPPPQPQVAPPVAGSSDERMWAMFAHLSALAGFIIPFGSILGPLIIWQIKKNEMPFVDDQGKEALNFQITVAILAIICILLILILIGILLLWALAIVDLIFIVIAGIAASNGQAYRYPFAFRFIK